jgi:hypothetical protein
LWRARSERGTASADAYQASSTSPDVRGIATASRPTNNSRKLMVVVPTPSRRKCSCRGAPITEVEGFCTSNMQQKPRAVEYELGKGWTSQDPLSLNPADSCWMVEGWVNENSSRKTAADSRDPSAAVLLNPTSRSHPPHAAGLASPPVGVPPGGVPPAGGSACAGASGSG